jgi:hypothetical protein
MRAFQAGICWNATFNEMATYNGMNFIIEQNNPAAGVSAMKWQYILAQWQRLGDNKTKINKRPERTT